MACLITSFTPSRSLRLKILLTYLEAVESDDDIHKLILDTTLGKVRL